MEVELRGLHIEDCRTEYITWHEVWRELNTAKTRIYQARHQSCQQGLSNTRHTFYQHMTICKNRC